jgi:hypothetical protein
MEFNAGMHVVAQDALLGLLAPIWQAVISVFLLLMMVVAGHRLFVRGPSRMSRAIVLSGGAIVGLLVLAFVFSMA